MNWAALIPEILAVLGGAGVIVWRAALLYAQIKTLHEEVERLRDWKHDTVNPLLQRYVFELEERDVKPAQLSYSDLADSRATDDPKKEPTK